MGAQARTSVGSDGGIFFAAQCGTFPLPSSLPTEGNPQGESALICSQSSVAESSQSPAASGVQAATCKGSTMKGFSASQATMSGEAVDACNGLSTVPKTMNLFGWSSLIFRQLMTSGTKFSYFVLKCVLACRGPRDEASTALFPLPLPLGDVWSSDLKRLSSTRRAKVAVKRSLFLVVAALNFLHFKEPFSQIKFLRRCPSSCHLQIFDRLVALIKAGGHSSDFDVLSCGRKAHQLVARIE